MTQMTVGVDLGGTKVRVGVVDAEGTLMGDSVVAPTGAQSTTDAAIDNLVLTVQEAANSAGVSLDTVGGVGIGATGPLDLTSGKILQSPNLPSLSDCCIVDVVSERLRLPVFLDNDANVFLLAESRVGALRAFDYLYGVTLGTGFGDAFVIRGEVYHGATGTATESWRSPYFDGVVEDYLSGRGLVALYRRIGEGAGPNSMADTLEVRPETPFLTRPDEQFVGSGSDRHR